MTLSEEHENSSTASQASVLLVEDDRSLRRYLEVMLQRAGYKVLTAEDGLEGMKIALASEIDIVVTDAIMPNLSGQQLARFLRGKPKFGNTPIVLLTGKEAQFNATDNSISAVLSKPVSATQLTDCLNRLLEKTAAS